MLRVAPPRADRVGRRRRSRRRRPATRRPVAPARRRRPRARQRSRRARRVPARGRRPRPTSDGALAARRGLVELATTAGRPAGESLAALVEAEHVPVDVLAWARELGARRSSRRCARGVRARPRARRELDAADDRLLATHVARAMASDEAYARARRGRAPRARRRRRRRAARRHPRDAVGEARAADAAPTRAPRSTRPGSIEARRVSSATEAAAAAMYPQIANALGGPTTLLYAIRAASMPTSRCCSRRRRSS